MVAIQDAASNATGRVPAFRILSKEESDRYPNLYEFLNGKCARCSGKSRIRGIKFVEGETVDFVSEALLSIPMPTQNMDEEQQYPKSAQVLIIENADADVLQHLLEKKVSVDERPSFLRFLDAHFHDQPSFNYVEIQPQVPLMPSTLTNQQYVTFQYVTTREFDTPFTLRYAEVQMAGRRAGSWRAPQTWGPMNPVQRNDSWDQAQTYDLTGAKTSLAPIAITRTRAAAWFNRNSSTSWNSGIILIDEAPKFVGLPASIKPSFARIGNEWYHDYKSNADLLVDVMKNNATLRDVSIPSPLLVVQDLYRLVAFEWLLLISYHARDLNSIEWVLQCRDGDGKIQPETLKKAMRDLFRGNRRLPHYLNLVRDQLALCQEAGRRCWSLPGHDADPAAAEITKMAAEELANDFSDIERRMTQLHDRLESSMALITGQTNILEAQRTHELNQVTVEQNKLAFAQNKILLALALVGTFFLPINSIAAIFSMGGRWAAGESSFPLFWAISIPISLGLVSALLLFMKLGGLRVNGEKSKTWVL